VEVGHDHGREVGPILELLFTSRGRKDFAEFMARMKKWGLRSVITDRMLAGAYENHRNMSCSTSPCPRPLSSVPARY
jgi:hypothetical protein